MANYYSQLRKHFFTLFQNLLNDRESLPADDQKTIQQISTDLDNDRLSELEFEQLLSNLINKIDDSMCVWKLLQNATSSHFLNRLPVMHLCSSPDIRTCLKDFKKYKSLLLPESYVVDVYIENDVVVMEVGYQGFESPIPLMRDDATVCLLLWILRQIGGAAIDFIEISFHSKRSTFELDMMARSTKAKITNREGNTRVYIATADIERKNLFYDKLSHEHMATQMESLRESLTEKNQLSKTVASILENSARPAAVTQEMVAESLGKSVSTFRRMMVANDSSFKHIQNKVLDERAVDILLSSETKIESIGLELGYTERSTFERAFKRKFGLSPSLFREQVRQLRLREQQQQFFTIIENLPPLPDSCKKIINEFNNPDLDVEKIINILDTDPIFSARIISLASKAMFGRQPKNLLDAVSRNLGVETVKNLAQVYAASDFLADSVNGIDVDKLITSITIGPKVFRLMAGEIDEKFKCEMNQVDQMLMFSLLSFLLVFHEYHENSQKVGQAFKDSDHLYDFLEKIETEFNLSIFGISGVLLSSWGMGEEIVRPIVKLNQVHLGDNDWQEFIIFTMAMCIAEIFQQKEATPFLKQKAEEFGIGDIDYCLGIIREYKNAFSDV